MPQTPATADTPPTTSTEAILDECLGPKPYAAPEGYKWVPNGWKLVPETEDFQSIFLNRIKPFTKKNPGKRMQVDMQGKVSILTTTWLNPLSSFIYLAKIHFIQRQKKYTVSTPGNNFIL